MLFSKLVPVIINPMVLLYCVKVNLKSFPKLTAFRFAIAKCIYRCCEENIYFNLDNLYDKTLSKTKYLGAFKIDHRFNVFQVVFKNKKAGY